MELGGCEERLPEESRWVGEGRGGSKANGAPNHREDCEGSETTGRSVGRDGLWETYLGRNCEKKDWQGVDRTGTGLMWV